MHISINHVHLTGYMNLYYSESHLAPLQTELTCRRVAGFLPVVVIVVLIYIYTFLILHYLYYLVVGIS